MKKYTHQINFFKQEKDPVMLTQEQVQALQAQQPMPDMIWVGDQCYNRSSIENITRLARHPDKEKCLQCHEYKRYGSDCPTCAERQMSPEEREKSRQKMNEMRESLGKKLGWRRDPSEGGDS